MFHVMRAFASRTPLLGNRMMLHNFLSGTFPLSAIDSLTLSRIFLCLYLLQAGQSSMSMMIDMMSNEQI